MKLLQCEDNGAEAAKGGAEDEGEEESGQSLEASNEQDGRVPGQHEDGDEQGRTEGFHLSFTDMAALKVPLSTNILEVPMNYILSGALPWLPIECNAPTLHLGKNIRLPGCLFGSKSISVS